MSQFDFGTINPTTKTGTVLASDLNSFRDALNSLHSGSSRPTYAVAGTLWIDITTSPWIVKVFDGSSDAILGSLDPGTHAFTVYSGAIAGGTGSGLDADTLDGHDSTYFLASSSYTAADVLTKIKTVDGSGSGLDADTLDGHDTSYFASQAALNAVVPGVGVGQSWSDVTGSRNYSDGSSNIYQNTTGNPIAISIKYNGTLQVSMILNVGSSGGSLIPVAHAQASNSDGGSLFTIVPPNHYYSLTQSAAGISFSGWYELR